MKTTLVFLTLILSKGLMAQPLPSLKAWCHLSEIERSISVQQEYDNKNLSYVVAHHVGNLYKHLDEGDIHSVKMISIGEFLRSPLNSTVLEIADVSDSDEIAYVQLYILNYNFPGTTLYRFFGKDETTLISQVASLADDVLLRKCETINPPDRFKPLIIK